MKYWITTLILCGLVACGDHRTSGGGNTTETGNSLTAQVILPGGIPAAQARVVLRAKIGVDTVLVSLEADGNGNFEVELPGDSGWVIEGASQDGALLGMLTAKASTMTLGKPLTIRGSFLNKDIGNHEIHLQGLGRNAIIDSSGAFELDSLPAGEITMVVRNVVDQKEILSEEFHVEAGDDYDAGVIPIPGSGLLLQTVRLTVPAVLLDSVFDNYPLLVRLDSVPSDSLTAVFQGKKLAWERDAGSLWILLDHFMVNALEDTLKISLMWGVGSPSAVFRSEDGWVSVLHLNDTQATLGPNLELPFHSTAGIAGTGALFDGLATGTGAQIPLLDSVGPMDELYVSGWYFLDSALGTNQVPWTAEYDGKTWILLGNENGGWTWRIEQDGAAETVLPGTVSVGEWQYVAMWLNPADNSFGLAQNGKSPVTQIAIGQFEPYIRPTIGYGFVGKLDEIRIRNRILSQAYQQLDTWIQRPGSTAIQIE